MGVRTSFHRASSADTLENKENLSYVIGVAIGDGNLSNPNGRTVRLRVTCATQYPNLIRQIKKSIEKVFPHNKVSLVKRKETYLDVSCYSNKWESILGWRASGGSKYKQSVSVPQWIKENKRYSMKCLQGLLVTDGSLYLDRGYRMINFTTVIPRLAQDVREMIVNLWFSSRIYRLKTKGKDKYVIKNSN